MTVNVLHSSELWFSLLVLLVGCERVAELVVARRNRRLALSAGGIEFGAGHYPAVVGLQIGLLTGCVIEVWIRSPPIVPLLAVSMLAVLILAQALRWWCIATLGPQWNTRIIVIPGARRVRTGPYRWFSHPNYVAVAVEGMALPLIGSAWITALAFTVLNAAMLGWRIRSENQALLQLRSPGDPR